jgi:hypothetical protein
MAFGTDPRAVWARYAAARAALVRVAGAFERDGIDVLAVKGVVTAGWLYADGSERPLGDVDIRIRPRDFGRAVRVAKRARWPFDRCVWTYRNLLVRVDGCSVDIECQVGAPFMCSVTIDAMFRRARRDPTGFWVPEPHDHAVLLTINVFKDKVAHAMPWAVEDLRRVVTKPEFDARLFVTRLGEAGVRGSAWIVADWLVARTADPNWRTIRDLLGGDAPPRAPYARLMKSIFASTPSRSIGVRVLTRLASDLPASWAPAIAVAAAWEVESRVDAIRRQYAPSFTDRPRE